MYKIKLFQEFKDYEWNKIVLKLEGDFNYTSYFLNYQIILLTNNSIKNLSFIVSDELDNPLCLSILFIENFDSQTQISRGGETIPFPLISNKLDENEKKNILDYVFKHIENIIKLQNVKNIKIRTPLIKENFDYNYYEEFLKYNSFKLLKTNLNWMTLKSNTFAVIDLFKKSLKFRSSYRSIINQSEKKFKLIIIDNENFQKENFENYSNFHNENKINKRSDKVFLANKSLILANAQAIFLCEYESQIIGSVVINYFNKNAFYQSSVNKKLTNRKIYPNHFLLNKSIEYLKEKKIRYFILGEIISKYEKLEKFTDKEKNISFFKTGWGSDIFISTKFEKNFN